MSTSLKPIYLPSELLSEVLALLYPFQLFSCLTVSRQWHAEALCILYRHIQVNKHTLPLYIQAFKSNKHFLRSIEWVSLYDAGSLYEKDVLDILIDYQATMPLSLLDEDIPLVPGPDRPMVRSFKLSGTLDSIQRFNDILFNLTSLTTLDLNWWPYSLEVKTNDMELDRILESLPNLKYLSMRGCDFESILPQSPALDSNGAMYKLKRFAFEVDLLSMPRSFLQLFRRLGNLTTIEVYGYDQWLEKIDSKAIADILKESCKKVERILTSGLVPLYLYILPPSVEVTNLVLRGDTPSGQRRIEELQRQQCEEAEEIFPRLTTFISTLSCILSAEDLRCLSVQAEFLTIVDLSKPLSDADDPYEEEDPTIDIYLQRNSGAQARHIIRSLDIQLFLENCRHLRHFGAERRTINLIDMTPPDKSKSLPEACHNSFSNGKLQVVREAKPWACEGTLERLEIGFRVYSMTKIEHQIVFAQLGRCKRLKILRLTRSNLIPTLSYGVDLLEGLSDSLEQILSWSSSWVLDDKKTIQWMLTKFKKLETMQTEIISGSTLYEKMNEWATEIGKRHILKYIYTHHREYE
ncbi:hypothetical protein BGZ46_009700 [Entomortierella lignicola]|nr:hypothetical protein BGZ46_009700 [Entomortierella lignicola]